MFENQKFLTSGVQNEIPSWLIDLIWCMVFSMKTEHKDYLQVFTLTKTPIGQHIVHELLCCLPKSINIHQTKWRNNQ